MHLNRHRLVISTAAFVAALSCLGAVTSTRAMAAAQDAADVKPVSFPVFRGEVGPSANVTLGGWGSGTGEPSKEAVLIGTNAIKVTTSGMYQGARLDFTSPIDLSEAFANPHTYMRFQMRFTGQGSSSAVYDPTTQQTNNKAAAPFRKMRYVLVMADNTRYELIRPVELPPSEDPDSWSPLAFPLSAITKQLPVGKTLSGDGAKLKQLAVFGDRYAQFLIGEINVITDETEINVAPLDDFIAFALQPTPFVAQAEGGASTLKFSWDFDASDGIQEDAVGRSGFHVFPRSNTGDAASGTGGQKTYKITLTVSDVDGIKKSQSVTLDLTVND